MAANKKIQVEIDVDSRQVDQAKTKIDELKGKTVELNKSISITYDIDGKPLDVVIDKTLNLQKQVKVLTAQLRNTKEGTAEFTILKNKLNDTQDSLSRVNAKSREFFGTLSLIPGPIGAISGQLQGAVDLLKTFSGFKLSDIGNQIKGLGNDIADVVKNILGLNSAAKNIQVPNITQTAGQVAGTTAGSVAGTTAGTAVGTAEGSAIGSAAGTVAATTALKEYKGVIEEMPKVYKDYATSIGSTTQELQGFANVLKLDEEGLLEFATSVEGERAQVSILGGEFRSLSEAELEAIRTGKALSIVNGEIAVSAEAAAVTTSALGKALNAIKIIAIITAAIYALEKLYDWLTTVNEATKTFEEEQQAASKAVADFEVSLKNVQNTILAAKNGVISKKEALKEYNDKLGKTIGYANTLDEAEKLMAANTSIVVESIKLRAEAQYLYGKAAEATGKIISGEASDLGFWEKAWAGTKGFFTQLSASGGIAKQRADNVAELTQKSKAWGVEADRLTLAAIENDKKLKGQRSISPEQAKADADEAYNKELKQLDALIALEIEKENTKREILKGLLDKKREMIIRHDKLTYAQAEILRIEDRKKLQQALTEDATRLIDFEIDKQNRLLSAVKQGSKEYYQYKTQLAKEEFKKEMELANLDEKTKIDKQLNAQSNLNKKLKDLDDEQLKQKEAWTTKQIELANGLIRKDEERQVAARQEKLRQDQLTLEQDINFIQSSEAQKAKLRKQLTDAAEVDITKIHLDAELKRKDDALKILQLKQEGLIAGTISYFKAQEEIINASQARDLAALDKKAFEELMKTEDVEKEKTKILEKYSQQRKDLLLKEIDTYLGYASAGLGVISNFLSQQQTINGLAMDNELKKVAGNAEAEDKIKEKYFYKNRDAQKGQAIIATLQSAVQAYSALAGIPIVGPVLGAAAAAAALIFGYKQVDLISSQTYQSTTSGGSSSAAKPAMANYGKNYGDGGMIEGPLHSSPQGGVPIMAEGGEAVMTRGAVTAFRPLLSMLNQMGGGTSFNKGAVGQAGYDNPKPGSDQPQIIKTYVVSSDLTSTAERNARLKNLSTL